MPKPDRDTGLLVEELGRLGVKAGIVTWDDDLDWAAIPLVVLRSPWDYFRRIDDFLVWATHVSSVTHLLNPIEVIRWNSHKSYLLELQDKGVAIPPTRLLRKGATITEADLPGLMNVWKTTEVVVKPAVSIGAVGAMKAAGEDPALAAHLADLLTKGDVLIQPFISSVPRQGETSLIYLGGEFSHAIRKVPAQGDYRVQDRLGGSLHEHTPTEGELKAGAAVLAAAPQELAYARVDLVEYRGESVLMEVELIEPELFLRFSSESVQSFARILKGNTDLD